MSGHRTAVQLILSLVAFSTLSLGAPICELILREETHELEDLRLAVDLTESELVAAEEIFQLLDGLWKADAVERMIYLAGKHNRDAAKLNQERNALLLKREDALLVQLRVLCGEDSEENLSQDRRREYDRAHAAYLEADCARLATEVALAEVDVAYLQEVLASVRDLRENDVATRQDVILAERDVAMARQRLEEGSRRAGRCPEEPARPDATVRP